MPNWKRKPKSTEPLVAEEILVAVDARTEEPERLETELEAVPMKKKKERRKRKRWYRHVDVNNGQRSFAAGLNIYKIIWVFVMGCVIGVAMETFFVYAIDGVLVRRSGMLYGPFNQVYGFGAVLFTLLLYRYRNKNGLIIFFASMVGGLAFEYVASWVQEMVFGSVSWDYTDMSVSIGGRTNWLYGIGWGILGLIFLTHFWPWMSEMIERIPNTIGKTLTILVAVFMVANLTLSAAAVYRHGQRLDGVPARTFIGRTLDRFYPNDYMDAKYPSMTFKNHPKDDEEQQQPSQSEPQGNAA